MDNIKKWDSILTMLKSLNKRCNYIVIRNYELFENNKLLSEHEDIDILCDNTRLLVETIGAKQKNTNDTTHYYIFVQEMKINVDIRVIGDTYYDELWQREMLERREMYKNLFYIPSIEDYYYSLIYHGLIHKDDLKDEYIYRIESMAHKMKKEFKKEELQNELETYMEIHNYKKTDYKSL